MNNLLEKKTMHFVGVSSKKSSSVGLFPQWTDVLSIQNAVLNGVDFKLHDDPEKYRKFVQFLKEDKETKGALVTTHKIDLFNAAKDLFDHVDDLALMFQEVSCIVKDKHGALHAIAVDPITSGLSMKKFIPDTYFTKNEAQVLILGAGGSMLAICYALSRRENEDIPKKIVITNRSIPRLEQAKDKLRFLEKTTDVEYIHCPTFEDNDNVLSSMPPHSLIVNATGLGKDSPGSPLTEKAQFPKHSIVWELNYRGDLRFMHQALEQKENKRLFIEDGWKYFVIGWATVICNVFDVELNDQLLNQFEHVSNKYMKGNAP